MKKIMLVLIILASLLPGILAVVQYFESEKKEKESKRNEIALLEKIDNLKGSNSELLLQTKQLAQDNSKLSHQLTETALKLNANVIGSDEIDFELSIANPNEFSFRILNKSGLPINNTGIVIQDYNKIIKCEVISEDESHIFIKKDCYKDNFINYSGININPHGMLNDKEKKYPITDGYMNFAIFIETRKNSSIYQLAYKLVNQNMVYSYRKYHLENNKYVYSSEKNNLRLNEDFWKENFHHKLLYTLDSTLPNNALPKAALFRMFIRNWNHCRFVNGRPCERPILLAGSGSDGRVWPPSFRLYQAGVTGHRPAISDVRDALRNIANNGELAVMLWRLRKQ